MDQPGSVEQSRAWLSVPIFAGPAASLSYDARLDCLDKAYRHLMARPDPPGPTSTRWLTITAVAASTDPAPSQLHRRTQKGCPS